MTKKKHFNNYDVYGYDKYGFDLDGYDIDGFNIFGFDRQGYDLNGYDIDGFNKDGFNRDGFAKDNIPDIYNFNYVNEDDNIDEDDEDDDEENIINKSKNNNDIKKIDNIITVEDLSSSFDQEELFKNDETTIPITDVSQIKSKQRIINKQTGERGQIDACHNGQVYFTMDKYSNSNTRTSTSVENFLELFLLDDNVMSEDYKQESLFNTKVRHYLYTDYYENILIPEEQNKFVPCKKTIINKDGFIETIKEEHDETQIRLNAKAEANKIANSAYFAHVDYVDNHNLYIGKNAIPGYVIDWADKQAAYYYEYKIYVADRKLGISLVRDIDLKDGKFFDFHDLYNRNMSVTNASNSYKGIADEKLIEIIERNKSSKTIHDIVESIQSKQYEIITCPLNKKCLILGCAGSGKTMILLHRIKYILFNNPNLDAKNLIVVSPTDILSREGKELAQILNINKINQFSTTDFYINIIRQIFENNKIFNKVNKFQIIESESDENIDNGIVTSCLDIINNNSNEKQNYINITREKISDEITTLFAILEDTNLMIESNYYYLKAIDELKSYSEFDIINIVDPIGYTTEHRIAIKLNQEFILLYLLKYIKKSSIKGLKYNNSLVQEHFQYFFSYIEKVNFESIESIDFNTEYPITRFAQAIAISSKETDAEKIKRLIDNINSFTYEEVEYMIYLIREEIEQCRKVKIIQEGLAASMQIIGCEFFGRNVESKLNKNVTSQEIIDRFKNLYIFMEMVGAKCNAKNTNPLLLFRVYNNLKLELQILESANSSNDYIFDMLINKIGIKRNRRADKIFITKQQLQKMLHIVINGLNIYDERKLYLFLDEFQDYSVEELCDLNKYFHNAIFNLYGDIRQCISETGISDVSSLYNIMSFDNVYELKENYRNASEITKYVNKQFGIDMYNIGLSGTVTETNKFELPKPQDNDRCAIIVANETIINNLKQLLSGYSYVHYYSKNNTIHNNYYNVLTVAQAKGLEFEKVIVIVKGMTRTQAYVAFTRAIRDLVVIWHLQN